MGDHTAVQTNKDLQNEVKGYVAGGIRWCASELGAHPKLTREGHLVTKANKSSDNIVSESCEIVRLRGDCRGMNVTICV